MNAYLQWSLRQLFVMVFQPTQFRREVNARYAEMPRLWATGGYLLWMLPWIVMLAVFGALVAGYIFDASDVMYRWKPSWQVTMVDVPYGVLAGVAFGMLAGMALGVPAGVAAGIVVGVVEGIAHGVAIGVVFGVARGVAVGVAGGLVLGVAFGGILGMAVSVIFGVTKGGAFSGLVALLGSVAFGGAFGWKEGVAFGGAVGIGFGGAYCLTYFRVVTYPLEAVLSIMVCLIGHWRRSAVTRAWHWCPVAWNEVIWIPLPAVGKLLAFLVQHNRTEGFRHIAFVAAERPLQHRAALAALVEVTLQDVQAQTVTALADIGEKLHWTTDAPVALPAALTAVLPRFDRIAAHAGQYLTLLSPYRKGEALRRALEEVDALQKSLITTRGRVAPRLLRMANEWRRLLEAEQEVVRVQREAVQEIPNPFVFGNAITETEHNVFTGRREIVRQVEDSVLGTTQAPTLLLSGPRRMGKTSLLNQLPRLLGPDFSPAVVDCQDPAVTGSAATFLRYLSRAVTRGLQRRRVTVEPLTAAALAHEPFAAFSDWFDQVEHIMPQTMRVLLCLDEYEHLQRTLEAGWGTDILDALRHMLQHRAQMVLMFIGVHTFEALGPVWTGRFISARRIRVTCLTQDEVLPLLTQPIPAFAMTYAPGALEALYTATQGQPFLTQAVAFELVQALNTQQRLRATPTDVEEAMACALVSASVYFANMWSDAGPAGQAILSAVAHGAPPPECPDAHAWLQEHEVLNTAGQFVVPMTAQWVRQQTVPRPLAVVP
jgi:hypothetical protein